MHGVRFVILDCLLCTFNVGLFGLKMTLEIKQLFREERFHFGWRLIPLLLYMPLGVILAVLRIFIGLQVLLAASILPQFTFVRGMILRTMCFVLGIIVKQEEVSNRDDSVRLILANHVSVLDHVAVHLLTGCISPSTLDLPAPLSWALRLKNLGQGEALTSSIRSHLETEDAPLLIHPEGSPTNGSVGLLKFESWPLQTTNKVQPCAIRTWRPPVTDVGVTVLAASYHWDILFFLFVPFTVFTVRYLNVIVLGSDETPAQGMERVETAIADGLGIKTTKFTLRDKMEHEKRYLAELYQTVTVPNNPVLRHQPSNQQLLRMSQQVKEVLPYVPLDVIRRDLVRTWDVDLTITNILEGQVPYIPEPQPRQSAPVIPRRASRPVELLRTSAEQVPATSIFSKLSKERGMSFQERKAQMIEEARRKYIEKHGLKIANT